MAISLLFLLLFCFIFSCASVGAINCTVEGGYEKFEEAREFAMPRVTILAGNSISIRCHDDKFEKIIFERQVEKKDVPCMRNRVNMNHTSNHASLYIAYLFEADTGMYQAKIPTSFTSDYDYSIFINVKYNKDFWLSASYYREYESSNPADCIGVPSCPHSEPYKHPIPTWAQSLINLVVVILLLGLVVYTVCYCISIVLRYRQELKPKNVRECELPLRVNMFENLQRNSRNQPLSPLLNAS